MKSDAYRLWQKEGKDEGGGEGGGWIERASVLMLTILMMVVITRGGSVCVGAERGERVWVWV